jgi:hypothetical protein
MKRMGGSPVALKLIIPLALLGACGDYGPLHPEYRPTGAYDLRESPDVSLPYPFPILGSTDNVSHSLLGETLTFTADGVVTRVRTIQRILNGKDSTYTIELQQEYRMWGDSIEVGRSPLCGATEYCIGNDAGRISVDGIELRSPSLQTGQRPPRARYLRR